jgi:protein-disulfide isomerase
VEQPTVRGANGSQVDVTLFMDWECPACLTEYPQFMQAMETLNRSHPGAIAWHIKDYPLDSSCNSNLKAAVHPSACDAAALVRLARQKGRADDAIAALAAAQAESSKKLTRMDLREIASNVLGPMKLEEAAAAVASDIARDVNEAAALKIRFVPAISVNGKLLDDNQSMQAEIESALRYRPR